MWWPLDWRSKYTRRAWMNLAIFTWEYAMEIVAAIILWAGMVVVWFWLCSRMAHSAEVTAVSVNQPQLEEVETCLDPREGEKTIVARVCSDAIPQDCAEVQARGGRYYYVRGSETLGPYTKVPEIRFASRALDGQVVIGRNGGMVQISGPRGRATYEWDALQTQDNGQRVLFDRRNKHFAFVVKFAERWHVVTDGRVHELSRSVHSVSGLRFEGDFALAEVHAERGAVVEINTQSFCACPGASAQEDPLETAEAP